ncbi:MAG TPA: outer membrane protein assembly factor BamA, partial [Candidatus Aminicenantes bacterium]|nr:outer membrane protein assembly factor BamA [Candidatus Aminicenantes bacterium]
MRKAVVLLIILVLTGGSFLFGQEIVEKIEIIGNERVTEETILYYLSSREGDYYNEDLIRRDFKVLWSTGFFANLRIEEEQGTRGKIIKVIVEENPIIKDIIFKTGKKLKENDIIDKLKEHDEYILPYSYYSPFKVERIKARIEELLREKGLTQGKVDIALKKTGKNELEVVFNIDEGPKIRVGEVVFVGRPKLPQSVLLSALKENKKHGLISWIRGKDTFKPDKLSEDLQNIKKKLQEYGYMEATIGEPRVEDVVKRSIFFKKQVMKKLIIPIDAGYRYRVGEIKIEGAKVFSAAGLRKMIKLKPGQLYNT